MAKPSKLPEWASSPDPADVVEPLTAKKQAGWVVEKPPHTWMNWLLNFNYQWAKWLDDVTSGTVADALTWAALHTFNLGIKIHQSVWSNPLIDSDDAPSTAGAAILLARFKIHSSGTNKVRLYTSETGAGGSMDIGIACSFNGTNWVADQTGTIAVLRITSDSFSLYVKSSAVATTAYALSAFEQYGTNAITKHNLTANTGWTNYSAPYAPYYYKDLAGHVCLRGWAHPNADVVETNSVAFAAGALPVGYRPSENRLFQIMLYTPFTASRKMGTAVVGSDGSITIGGQSSIDGMDGDTDETAANNAVLDSIRFFPG